VLLSILGDRFGRKSTIVVGLPGVGGVQLLTMFATDLTTLRLLRIGSGIGVGGVLQPYAQTGRSEIKCTDDAPN